MTAIATIRPGDTLSLACAYVPPGGSPSLVGVNVRAWVATREGAKVAELSVRMVDVAQGTFALDLLNTGAWPLGLLAGDIRYTWPDNSSLSSGKFYLSVEAGVTPPVGA